MHVIACKCLNVKVFTKTDISNSTPVELDDSLSHPFFKDKKLFEVVLNLQGVYIEHNFLIERLNVSGWIIKKCMNCQMMTHAKNIETDQLLVSSDLIVEKSEIDKLTSCVNYSPMYKIVIEKPVTNMNSGATTISNNIRTVLQAIQSNFEDYIGKEESEMKNRIKAYEEQERCRYDDMKSRLTQDKNKLISVLVHNDCNKSKNVGFIDEGSDSSPTTSPVIQLNNHAGKFKGSFKHSIIDNGNVVCDKIEIGNETITVLDLERSKDNKLQMHASDSLTSATSNLVSHLEHVMVEGVDPSSFTSTMDDGEYTTSSVSIPTSTTATTFISNITTTSSSSSLSPVSSSATTTTTKIDLSLSSSTSLTVDPQADHQVPTLGPEDDHPILKNYSPSISPMPLGVPISIPEEDEEEDAAYAVSRSASNKEDSITGRLSETADLKELDESDNVSTAATPTLVTSQTATTNEEENKLTDKQKHHPFIVGSFEPEDVFLFTDEDGSSYKTSETDDNGNITSDDDHEIQKSKRIIQMKKTMEVNDDNGDNMNNIDDDEDTDDEMVTTPGLYSMSVPITVPWTSRQMSKKHDETIDETPVDEESMAAAIRAMARSVKVVGDGSELFGELPSSNTKNPRLSTLSKGDSSENEAALAIG